MHVLVAANSGEESHSTTAEVESVCSDDTTESEMEAKRLSDKSTTEE